MTVEFRLDGQPYVGLNGGPQFTFSEAISFQIMCGDQEEVDRYWSRLVRRRRGGPVRVAQGPVRRLVAGRPDPALRAAQPTRTRPGPSGRSRRCCGMHKIVIAEVERAADAVPA